MGYEIRYRIPGAGGWKTKGFESEKAATEWVRKQRDGDNPDMEVVWQVDAFDEAEGQGRR